MKVLVESSSAESNFNFCYLFFSETKLQIFTIMYATKRRRRNVKT